MLVRLLCMRLYSQLLIVLHHYIDPIDSAVLLRRLLSTPFPTLLLSKVAAYGTYVALTLQSTYFKNKTQHMESYTISDIVANGGVRSCLIL